VDPVTHSFHFFCHATSYRIRVLLFVIGSSVWVGGTQAAIPMDVNWPSWRGDGSGISAETNLPMTWDATNHVVWRTPLPGEGSSSPIVWGQRVFLTASTDHGTNRLVLCLDAQDGHVLWQRNLVASRIPQTDPKAGYAPASPGTDGQRLYVFFDSPGLMAFDMEGTLLWTMPLGPFKSPYNITASPIVFRDRVIQCCDHGGEAFILAADSTTGQLLWKTPRKQSCQYGTPLLFEHKGVWQVVVGATTVKAYDPMTGREIWSCAGLSECVSPSPVSGDEGLVYATSGRNCPSLAINSGGTGDVTETHIRMQVPTGGPYVPSPLFSSVLVLPADDGVVRLISSNGMVRIAQRLRAHFTSSPILAGSNIYWTAENGNTYVLDASRLGDAEPTLRVVAVNPLGEKNLASPAVANGRLFIRTDKALYCLGGSGASRLAELAHPLAGLSFTELQRRFQAHPAADGDDIPVRLSVVDALSELRNDEAVTFLKTIAEKDPHWDVCEAAAKAVSDSNTPATVPALMGLVEDSRDYMKTIAAGGLGRLRVPMAVPALLAGVAHKKPIVRIARLQALAEIAMVPEVDPSPILAVLQAAMADKDGTVRLAAVRGFVTLVSRPGADRKPIVSALQACASDSNPLVSAAARDGLIHLQGSD
jgi:outer membrane protein assembly factor BamB